MKACRLEAGAVALSVEVGQGPPCRVHLEGNTCTVREAAGVVLSLWAAEVRRPTPVEVRLDGNTCAAGRIVALRALPASVRVTAGGNHFAFRAGVLSVDGYPAPDGWRRTTAWQDRDNRYDGPGPWLRVEGRPASVHDLAGWRRLWGE
jgi:hypothetical protein